MYKVGIIGCGKIAQVRHIPEYAALDDVSLVAFFDINIERAKELANQYGGKAYDSYEELLNDSDIDAVSVCAANNVHAEITVKALEAGKHVLCEKPMAMSIKECNDMVEASKKSGKYLMIGHNQRLAKAHKKAKELIDSGSIGKIVTFKTNFVHRGPETWSIDPGSNVWFFDKDIAIMGAMADLGIHKTDLIQFLLSDTVDEVTSVMTTLEKSYSDGTKIGVDDNSFCIYKMNSGIIGTMTVGWTCYGKEDNSTIIYGTDGVMRIYDDPKYSIIIEKEDDSVIKYEIDKIQTNDNQTSSGVIDLFMEAIRNDVQPEVNGEEALSAMKTVFACLKSSNERRTIKVNGGE